jgi:hypothetical protein
MSTGMNATAVAVKAPPNWEPYSRLALQYAI